jgi:hypothetical protein
MELLLRLISWILILIIADILNPRETRNRTIIRFQIPVFDDAIEMK